MMWEVTWPLRSYLIGLAANLATAWMVIAYDARLVSNRFLRRVVKWLVWIYATFYCLGLMDENSALFDGFVLSIGDVRISALTVFAVLVIVTASLTAARLVPAITVFRYRSRNVKCGL